MFSFQKGFFLALLASAEASFHRDVIRGNKQRNLERILNKKNLDPSTAIHQELLGKALPLGEYEQKHGVDLGRAARKLNDANGEDAADYDMISFSGYSMKFAKCQPVQYFSERALELGEHSPMITNDIVILRLCPSNSCSDNSEYGCHYNYAEYAIDLSDYIRIMLEYAAVKRDYTCDYCNQCLGYGGNNNGGNNRKLNDAGGEYDANGYDDNQQDDQNYQDAQDDGDQDQNAQQNDEADAYDQNNYDPDEAYKYACNNWDTYCSDYGDLCVNDQDGEANQEGEGENGAGGYMDFEQYEEYLDCTQVDINEYAYFVKPRCDGYQGTIKMGIFYDKYCNQYAGNDINLKNAGLGFKESIFQDFSSKYCVECSESDYPPYDAPNEMCNDLFYNSAKCTDDLSDDLVDSSSEDESTACSFIESIRLGTYNELGQLTGGLSNGSMSEQMTDNQKMILGIAVALSSFFIVYACYLHHAMTNLLIKSLSHRELLPPSRHQNYRSRTNPRRSGRQLQKVDDEPDWDDNNSAEYA